MLPLLYLDECVHTDLAALCRNRGITTTTAADERTLGLDDESQLLFATRHGWVLVSHNQRDFQRLHRRFLAAGRSHAGILLIPIGSLRLLVLRVTMLAAWVTTLGTSESRLTRWHDLQARLTRGLRLDGFSEAQVRQALAIDPIEP